MRKPVHDPELFKNAGEHRSVKPPIYQKETHDEGGHQTLLSQYFNSTTQNASDEPTHAEDSTSAPGTFYNTLHIIDYKTRNSRSIPSVRDQYQSRLQLMLYKRLLGPLMDPTAFIDTISRLRIDTAAPFSPAFIQTQEYLCESNGLDNTVRSAMCMGDLMIAWMEALPSLGLRPNTNWEEGGAVDEELELIYRLRKGYGSQRRNVNTVSREASFSTQMEAEPHKINFGVNVGPKSPFINQASAPSPSVRTSMMANEDPVAGWARQESLSPDKLNAAVFGLRKLLLIS